MQTAKALETLIRLRRQALDQRRKRLAGLEQSRQMLDDERAALERSMIAEQQLAAGRADLVGAYGGYARRVIAARAEFDSKRALLDREIAAVHEEISIAFSELKKFEIAQTARQRREQAEAARQETQAIDEVGVDGFRRKKARER